MQIKFLAYVVPLYIAFVFAPGAEANDAYLADKSAVFVTNPGSGGALPLPGGFSGSLRRSEILLRCHSVPRQLPQCLQSRNTLG